MSKQFQLYSLPSDARSLVEEIRSRFGVKILSETSPTKELSGLSSPVREQSTNFRTGASTSIRCYLSPVFGRLVVNDYRDPDRWVIQPESEAIQFAGCDFDGTTLLVGRMYFQTDLVLDGGIVSKRPEFLKWANDVFRLSKRALHRDPQLAAYVGKDAANFRQNGGKFASSIRVTGEPVYE
jgi:hypothetical protein